MPTIDHGCLGAADCPGCAGIFALEASRDAYRDALRALVDAMPKCSNCGGQAMGESCDGYNDHCYGCSECGGLPEWLYAPQLLRALALLAVPR